MIKVLIGVLVSLLCSAPMAAAAEAGSPGGEPEERKTRKAERRTEFLSLGPEEQAAVREERRARREKRRAKREERRAAGGAGERRARPVELYAPIPMPVQIQNAEALTGGGAPAGEACPAGKSCTLRFTAPAGQVVVVTAVWSASKVQCDGVTSATPANGAPINPQWRCGRLTVTGTGAGYVGFLSGQ